MDQVRLVVVATLACQQAPVRRLRGEDEVHHALKAQEPGNLLRREANLLPKPGDEPLRTPTKLLAKRRDRNATARHDQLPPGPGNFRRWSAGMRQPGGERGVQYGEPVVPGGSRLHSF